MHQDRAQKRAGRPPSGDACLRCRLNVAFRSVKALELAGGHAAQDFLSAPTARLIGITSAEPCNAAGQAGRRARRSTPRSSGQWKMCIAQWNSRSDRTLGLSAVRDKCQVLRFAKTGHSFSLLCRRQWAGMNAGSGHGPTTVRC
jgi:hypothetical protein